MPGLPICGSCAGNAEASFFPMIQERSSPEDSTSSSTVGSLKSSFIEEASLSCSFLIASFLDIHYNCILTCTISPVNETEETEAKKIDLRQPFVILEKLDGSMVCPFHIKGELRCVCLCLCVCVVLFIQLKIAMRHSLFHWCIGLQQRMELQTQRGL